MHSTSGAWKEYSFQPRWRCCCERIWVARLSGRAKACSSAGWSSILRRMVPDDAAEPAAQDAQLPLMPPELFGMGVAARHHRSRLGDSQVGLPQPDAVPSGQAVEPLDGRMQQLGIGRKGNGL